MKFYRMEADGSVSEIDLAPGTVLGSPKGQKTAAQARPDELCWIASGDEAGTKVVLDYQSWLSSWRKPEWKIDSKSLGVDRWHKLVSDKRTRVKEIVEMLRYAEQTAFGCVCPVGCAMLTIGWDQPHVTLRPGPGFPKTAEMMVAIIGCMDWGVPTSIERKAWTPDASKVVLADVKLYAEWDWQTVVFECSTREEAWCVLRAVRSEIRRYVGDVKAVQLGPPSITDWVLGAASSGLDVPELMREQQFKLRTEGATMSQGWKPEWQPEMAKDVCGEPCMIVVNRAWTQATCENDIRSAPDYHWLGGRGWVKVVAPANDEVREPRPDPMTALQKMVRE